jgi:antibiotic biosynthesis monooxygenase (ABM) superfamily enzyme
MTTIEQGTPIATLINVFTVAPERQRELVDLLVRTTDEVMRHQPGFLSANIHASPDGTRVANYAQWESVEHFQRMQADPTAREHMGVVAAMATFEPALYDVVSVHER